MEEPEGAETQDDREWVNYPSVVYTTKRNVVWC